MGLHQPQTRYLRDRSSVLQLRLGENFERVVVRRLGQRDYCTEFVACVLCKVMFYVPEAPHQADPTLEHDATIAARLYKRPGRRR